MAAAQIDLLNNSDNKVEAEQAHHNAEVVVDSTAVAVVDFDFAVVEDKGIPHHFFCTIPVWQWYSYTSE